MNKKSDCKVSTSEPTQSDLPDCKPLGWKNSPQYIQPTELTYKDQDVGKIINEHKKCILQLQEIMIAQHMRITKLEIQFDQLITSIIELKKIKKKNETISE